MNHEQALSRLPDLLDDRDDAELLAHVRYCSECQRQLFLLGRVDRMLRDDADSERAVQTRRSVVRRASAAAVAVAATTAAVLMLLTHGTSSGQLVLRTPGGRSVAHATMGHDDARNTSLVLTASAMPTRGGHMFTLWASDRTTTTMQVGRFMVDHAGRCHARFNLPNDHTWSYFWVTSNGEAGQIVAST